MVLYQLSMRQLKRIVVSSKIPVYNKRHSATEYTPFKLNF